MDVEKPDHRRQCFSELFGWCFVGHELAIVGQKFSITSPSLRGSDFGVVVNVSFSSSDSPESATDCITAVKAGTTAR